MSVALELACVRGPCLTTEEIHLSRETQTERLCSSRVSREKQGCVCLAHICNSLLAYLSGKSAQLPEVLKSCLYPPRRSGRGRKIKKAARENNMQSDRSTLPVPIQSKKRNLGKIKGNFVFGDQLNGSRLFSSTYYFLPRCEAPPHPRGPRKKDSSASRLLVSPERKGGTCDSKGKEVSKIWANQAS